MRGAPGRYQLKPPPTPTDVSEPETDAPTDTLAWLLAKAR
jgi:hypothetical protein